MSSIRPYGDTTGDGMVQTSFTLPMPPGPKAEGAAMQLANKMGIDPAMVVHSHGIGGEFTFFVVYGSVKHLVDLDAITVVEREYPLLSPTEVNGEVRKLLRRKLGVVGGSIGTDAHTVGIDAILNIKGFAGEKGLEYYRELKVVNLGAQVTVPELVKRGPRGEGGRGAGVAGGDPARRAHPQHAGDVGRVPRGHGRPAPRADRGRPPVRPDDGRATRCEPGVRPRHDARRGGELPRARVEGEQEGGSVSGANKWIQGQRRPGACQGAA